MFWDLMHYGDSQLNFAEKFECLNLKKYFTILDWDEDFV